MTKGRFNVIMVINMVMIHINVGLERVNKSRRMRRRQK